MNAKRFIRSILACSSLSLLPWSVDAQVFGMVEAMHGSATLSGVDGRLVPLQAGSQVVVGQTLQTGSNSEVHLVTQDGGLLALRANTTFQMVAYRPDADSSGQMGMSLIRGALRSISGWIGKLNPNGYRITTPTATIGIRGTDHETTVLEAMHGRDPAGTYDSVQEGSTFVRTDKGDVQLHAGEHGFAPTGEAGAPRKLADRPEFIGQRKLHIEDRIPERKEHLRQELIQKAATLPEQSRSLLRSKLAGMDDDAREAAKRRLLRKPPRRQVD